MNFFFQSKKLPHSREDNQQNKKAKRMGGGWGQVFSRYLSNMRFISGIYKELKIIKPNNTVNKWPKRRTQMANKCICKKVQYHQLSR